MRCGGGGGGESFKIGPLEKHYREKLAWNLSYKNLLELETLLQGKKTWTKLCQEKLILENS